MLSFVLDESLSPADDDDTELDDEELFLLLDAASELLSDEQPASAKHNAAVKIKHFLFILFFLLFYIDLSMLIFH